VTGDVQRWAPFTPARTEPRSPERVWVDAEVIPDTPTGLMPILDAEVVVPRSAPVARYVDPPTVVVARPAPQRPTRRNDLRGLPMALIILAFLVLVSVMFR
jgi:hypothetical protein